MDEWRLRLNEYEGYYDQLCAMFNDELFKWVLFVHHTGKKNENPHFHAVFRTEGVTRKALAEMIKTRFTKAKGNKNYSLLESDGRITAKSYLFHEHTPVEYSKNVSSEELKEFQQVNDDIQEDIKENRPLKILDKVIDILRSTGKYKSFCPSSEAVFVVIVKELLSRGEWIPNSYQMTRWINRVRSQFAIDNGKEEFFIKCLYSEFYPHASPIWSSVFISNVGSKESDRPLSDRWTDDY